MDIFKSAFARRLRHKPTHATSTNLSVDEGCHRLRSDPTRFVQKVEICTALSDGEDAWHSPVSKDHHHTLLRVSLVPTPNNPRAQANTLLIERVLSTGGAHHSVTPIRETFSLGGTLFYPDVYDRLCIVSDSTTLLALARDLEVERTLAFGDGDGASRPSLTLAQCASVLDLVSRASMRLCAGGDCKYQSRAFAFACMAALTPRLPPSMPTSVRRSGEAVGMNVRRGTDLTSDAMFELAAQGVLEQLPWLITEFDAETRQALALMVALKDKSRNRAQAGVHP